MNTTGLGRGTSVAEHPRHGARTHSASRHALVALSGQWGKYVLQLAALVVFSRLLTPADIGLVAMVTAVVGIAYVIGDFGLSLAALQDGGLDQRQRSNLFWWNGAIGILVAAVVAALAVPLAALYDDPRVTPVTLALASVFAINGIGVQFRTELNLTSRFGVLASADVVGQAAGFAVAVAAGIAGWGYWALVVMQIVAAIVTTAVVIARAHWRPGRYHRDAPMRSLLSFGTNTFLAQLVNYVSTNIDQVLVGRAWGASTLGFYNRAFQIARIPAQQVAAPLTRVALPHLARARDDAPRFAATVRRIQLALSTLLVGLLALVAATADALVPVVLGPGWSDAVPMLRALCLAGAVQAIGYIAYWILLAHARTGLLLGSEFAARAIMVALMIAVAPWGPVWVALAAAVGQVLLVASSVFVALPRVGMGARVLTPALRPTLTFCVAGAAAWGVGPLLAGAPAIVSLIAMVAVFGAAAAAFAAIPAYRRDAREIAGMVRSVRRGRAVAG